MNYLAGGKSDEKGKPSFSFHETEQLKTRSGCKPRSNLININNSCVIKNARKLWNPNKLAETIYHSGNGSRKICLRISIEMVVYSISMI